MKYLKKKGMFGLCAIILIIFAASKISLYSRSYRPLIDYAGQEITSMRDVGLLSVFNDNRIIENGENGEWDEHIREIGNIVYYPKLSKSVFFYSGYKGQYAQNNVYVGYAVSDDGVNWEKKGKALSISAEDPYAVISQDKIYLFFEDKEEVPFRRISLAVSEDLNNWAIVKRGVLNPQEGSIWQSQDVSSPVVVHQNDKWVMLYEGRSSTCGGAIGYAVSEDLLKWSQKDKPVIEGIINNNIFKFSWEGSVVPDDIIYNNENYFLTYHGSGNTGWQTGLAVSSDLVGWSRVNKYPIHSTNTLMVTRRGKEVLFISTFKETNDVRFMKPLKIYELPKEKY